MKFEPKKRFGDTYWFCGIYKIVEYKYYRNQKVKPYFRCYYICDWQNNWGDYVPTAYGQSSMTPTFKQCVAMAEEHAKDYTPSAHQINTAAKVIKRTYSDV